MVHELVHVAWRWTAKQFDIILEPTWTGKAIVVGLLVLALIGAAALYHLVEEPCRKWMRRMLDVGPAVTETEGPVAEDALEPQRQKVKSLREAQQAHPEEPSARAG
jgi:peptidoglycan/LPS O-acetylase OafA/YrhL